MVRSGVEAEGRGPLGALRGWPWPRLTEGLLGVWLFASAFAWRHAPSARVNAALLGIMIALSALWAMAVPPGRWLTAALAAWVVASSFVLRHAAPATVWNDAAVGLCVFLLSLVRSPNEERTP